MSISKRLWDLARANATDFAGAFLGQEEELTAEERAELEREIGKAQRDSVGKRAGRRAKEVRDRAEEAWEKAYEAAQNRSGEGGFHTKSDRDQIEDWYKVLEVPSGSDLSTVRKAYRKMLAKYHPDRYAQDPEKYQAATEVARKITTAYNGLRNHLS